MTQIDSPPKPRSTTGIRPVPVWFDVIVLLAIVALAAGLRAYHLGTKSLWLDEIAYVRSAQMGGLFGPYGLASISHPPGYLFIMRLMGSLSHEEWLLRLPALLASVLGVVAAWGLGRSLVGRIEGLLAALLLALSALHLEYAQEAHSYALFGTLSTFLLWSLSWVATRSVRQSPPDSAESPPLGRAGKLRSVGPWAIVVLLAAADLYIHYYALVPVGLSLVVFPCFLLAAKPGPISSLWRDPAKRRAFLHLLIALAVVALLFLPQLGSQLLGSARIAADRTQALEAGTIETPFALQPSLFADTLLAFITNRSPWSVDPLFAPTVVGLWLAGLAWLLWRRRAAGLAFLAWMLLPLPLIAWFAYRTGFSFAPRRLIFILPVFLLVVATGITTLGRLAAWITRRASPSRGQPELARWASWAMIGLVLLAFAKGSADPITAYFARPKQDWKGLATILRAVPQPGDAVVVLPNATFPLEWYYPGPHDVIAADLAPKLQALCEKSPAVYVAASTTGKRILPEDVDWLTRNTITVPLKDLRLYYRNCRPDTWYGAGAEPLFKLARRPGLTFPAAGKALQEYQALAAEQQATLPPLMPTPPAGAPPAPATPVPEAAPDATLVPDPAPLPPDTATIALPEPAAGLAELLMTLAGERAGDAIGQVWLGAYQARIGALDEARRHFEQVIQQAPDDWLAYALLAASYINAGQSQQAQAIVAQGLEAIPDSPALAALQVRLQGEDANTPDGLKEALDRGRQALREQDWATAIAAGQQAVALAPGRSDSHLLLGDAYRASGELGQALASYRRATELTPQLSLYHARQSEILVRLGQPADALDRALLALALEDSRWENWLALGRALGALGETDPGYLAWAGHALAQAVALAPENNQAPARALAEFQAAQQTRPASAGSPTSAPPPKQTAAQQRAQAEALLQAGQADQALAQYQALIDADPQDRASRMGVAAALKALGRVDEAIAAYEQISSEWPDFPFANVRRGELLERQDNLAGAIDAYRAAVQAAPDNADLRFTLAFALRRAGQRDDAMAELQAGLKLDPARQTAQEALQELQSGKP